MEMVSLTLSIPKEMKMEMEKFQEINWSAVAREAIKRKMLGKKISRKIAKKYKH